MATRLRKELTYDASAEEVAAMLADPAFRQQVLDNLGVLRGSVEIEGSSVTIEQVQTAKGLPSFATKFVGDEITILQKEEWASPTRGDITVTIPGKPGEMVGTAELVEDGATTTEVIDMEISVRIPLVAGKIEKLIADMLGQALDTEHRTGVAWLAG